MKLRGFATEVKAVLFDMDGTLIDSIQVYERLFDEIFRRFQLPPVKKGLVAELVRQGRNPWIDVLPSMSFTKEMIIKAQKIDKEVFPLMYEKYVRVFPGVLPLLSELKKRAVKTAIVTSSWFEEGDPEPIKRLKGMVDVLVTKFDTERHKPHPAPIFKACEELHVAPEYTLYVGDSPLDIKAGKAAEVQTVGVLWGIGDREKLEGEGSDEIVANSDELRQVILSRI